MENVKVQISLSENVANALEKIAKGLNKTKSKLIENLIIENLEYLQDLEDLKEMKQIKEENEWYKYDDIKEELGINIK